ncbi:MAG TPA: endonuclease III [Ktedonobacteraceae bacterium]|nr:endonuclease III [Ktedonobacteraceae bacterium]
MTTSIPTAAHLARVYNLLIEAYGEPRNEPDFDPLGGLLGTILSQHTSDINSERAYRKLVETFPNWEAVRDAPTAGVAEVIRCGGLANIKAVRIQDVLHTLTEQKEGEGFSGALTEYLSAKLATLAPEEGWRYLRTLPGVGPKTAACVLMFNLGEPVMPVDTHVHRVSKRLGLIGPRVSADQAHEVFAKMVPRQWVYPLHVNLIRHGRRICHAQKPECDTCLIYRECAFVGNGKG